MANLAIRCDDSQTLLFKKADLEAFMAEVDQIRPSNTLVRFGKDIENTPFFMVMFNNGRPPKVSEREDGFNYCGYFRVDAVDDDTYAFNQSLIIKNKTFVPLFVKLLEQSFGTGAYYSLHQKKHSPSDESDFNQDHQTSLTDEDMEELDLLIAKLEIDALLDAFNRETNVAKKEKIKRIFKKWNQGSDPK